MSLRLRVLRGTASRVIGGLRSVAVAMVARGTTLAVASAVADPAVAVAAAMAGLAAADAVARQVAAVVADRDKRDLAVVAHALMAAATGRVANPLATVATRSTRLPRVGMAMPTATRHTSRLQVTLLITQRIAATVEHVRGLSISALSKTVGMVVLASQRVASRLVAAVVSGSALVVGGRAGAASAGVKSAAAR